MKPFHLSTTARALSIAAAAVLAAAGLALLLGIAASSAIPLLLSINIIVGVVALGLGARNSDEERVLLTILLPLALFFCALGLLLIADLVAAWSWELVLVGALPPCLLVASLVSRIEAHARSQWWRASALWGRR